MTIGVESPFARILSSSVYPACGSGGRPMSEITTSNRALASSSSASSVEVASITLIPSVSIAARSRTLFSGLSSTQRISGRRLDVSSVARSTAATIFLTSTGSPPSALRDAPTAAVVSSAVAASAEIRTPAASSATLSTRLRKVSPRLATNRPSGGPNRSSRAATTTGHATALMRDAIERINSAAAAIGRTPRDTADGAISTSIDDKATTDTSTVNLLRRLRGLAGRHHTIEHDYVSTCDQSMRTQALCAPSAATCCDIIPQSPRPCGSRFQTCHQTKGG